MMPVYAARKDGNQTQIVTELRQCGIDVEITHTLGNGFGDIVCGWRERNYIFEIKDPAQPPSKRRLTKDEEEFHREWGGQIDIILTTVDALKVMGILPNSTGE